MKVLRSTVRSGALDALLDSLAAAKLRWVRWRGRESRSGATFFLRGLEARLETFKHLHELSCFVTRERTLACSWRVDGREVAQIEVEPGDATFEELLEAIGYALRLERVDYNEVEVREKPVVELEPY